MQNHNEVSRLVGAAISNESRVKALANAKMEEWCELTKGMAMSYTYEVQALGKVALKTGDRCIHIIAQLHKDLTGYVAHLNGVR